MVRWDRLKKILLSIALFSCSFISAENSAREEILTKRVYAHLLIGDHNASINEAKSALKEFPQSKKLHEAIIRGLSEVGKDHEAILYWKILADKYPEEWENYSLLESIAWGVLFRAERSSQIETNAASLVGAFLTRDARAVPVIMAYLRSSNALLRSFAVKLAISYRDRLLVEEMKRLLKEEPVWYVRLEVIRAIGAMGIEEAKNDLLSLISSDKAMFEEKYLAMESLVQLYDQIEKKHIKRLISSKRAGLRHLACEIVSHFDHPLAKEEILKLLKDPSADVRISALNTIGLIKKKDACHAEVQRKILELIDDSHPGVSITASYLAFRFDPKKARKGFQKWLTHAEDKIRCLASVALVKSGIEGAKWGVELLKTSENLYIKANIALGLIGHDHQRDLACETLIAFLEDNKTQIMWDRLYNPLFIMLSKSRIHHIPSVPQYPAVIDQMTRLELLNILSILRHPKAEEALKVFLKSRLVGIPYIASTTLMEEGESDAVNVLTSLLKDEDEVIRLQAALVLVMFGGDHQAIKTLEELYPNVDREIKIQILEVLGRKGERDSLPFLMQQLDEPFHIVRVVAACAIIQCVFH